MSTDKVKLWDALNWPNRISLLRLALLAPFVLLLQAQGELVWARQAALGIAVVMGISDFLDGLLARRLRERTRLGAILDPLADKALIICAAVLLSLPHSSVPGLRLPAWVVVAIVGKDLWVIVGFVVLYLVTNRFRVRPTLAGKAATFGQLVMVVSVLVGPDLDGLGGDLGRRIARGTWLMVTALSILAAISYTRLGLRFVLEGQQPLDETNSRAKVHDGRRAD